MSVAYENITRRILYSWLECRLDRDIWRRYYSTIDQEGEEKTGSKSEADRGFSQ
jgi:hypothetical protein